MESNQPGQKIKKPRLKLGLSQDDFARKVEIRLLFYLRRGYNKK